MMVYDHIITEFTTDDLNELVEAEKVCFPGDPWSREAFLDALASGSCHILCAKDMQTSKIVAYSVILCVLDQADLANIAVLPECRGKKLGRELLLETLKKAREMGVSEVFLEVRESNLAARGLYLSSGFVEIGVRRNYYTAPRENAVIMMKKLIEG
ncbi:MAG: ribosomal protein S18-alanine N-acetyltransferase [Clostridia bacterium]|nr:ribosomal protein S18-alanine N-acetyltransferase [Clostridia bacterium]